MKFSLLSFILVVCLMHLSNAQSKQYTNAAMVVNELSEKNTIKLNVAIAKHKTADELIIRLEELKKETIPLEKVLKKAQSDAIRQTNQMKLDKILNSIDGLQREIISLYHEGNKIKFNTYTDHFRSIRGNLPGNEFQKKIGLGIEQEAATLYKKAQQQRALAFEDVNQYNRIEMLFKADVIEKKSITKQEEAFELYLNWKVKDVTSLNPPTINDKSVLFSHFELQPYDKEKLESMTGLDQLKTLLDEESTKKLQEIEEIEKSVEKMIEETQKLERELQEYQRISVSASSDKLRSKNAKKAAKTKAKVHQKKQEIAAKSKEAHDKKYTAYQKGIEIAKTQFAGSDSLKNRAGQHLSVADNYFQEAQSTRDMLVKIDDESIAAALIMDAFETEQKAIVQQEEAIEIYMNKTEDEITQQLINVAYIQDSTIVWRIQISANKNPIPENELDDLYHGDYTLFYIKDNLLHKYLIGNFRSFDHANNYRINLAQKNAFVVQFRYGKIIGVDRNLKSGQRDEEELNE